MNYDVVVVGAGPVGLSVALALGIAEQNVLLLEKDPHLHEHSRAPAIWPRTQEILNDLGVMKEISAQAIVHKQVNISDADGKNKVLLRLPLNELSSQTDFPQLVVLPQQKTEQVLLNEIHRNYSNVKVVFSAEFVDFKEEHNSVVVTYIENGETKKVRANFLVGCDGAHSGVRERLGFHLEGLTYKVRASLADIQLSENNSFASPRITTQCGLVVAIQIEPKFWRLIFPHFEGPDFAIDDRLSKAVASLFASQGYRLVWTSDFKLHRRVSTGFQKGRVVLAGDAAHLNSPVGGQGMNSGIQDGAKLVRALLESQKCESTEPLKLYSKRRREEILSGVNRFTNILTRLLFWRGGHFIKIIFKSLNLLLQIKYFRHKVLKKVSMLEP